MIKILRYSLLIMLMVLITGCSNEVEDSESHSKVSIESYSLSEHESELISKTGVGQIEYFKLNGVLAEEEELQFSVEVYVNGKLKSEQLKSYGDVEKNYKDTLISFGISDYNDEKRSFKLISGIPSGLATTNYPNNMTSFTFNKLVKGTIKLKKDVPAYLASWQGTTKDELRSDLNENGELPENITETELVFLYKVLWRNADN